MSDLNNIKRSKIDNYFVDLSSYFSGLQASNLLLPKDVLGKLKELYEKHNQVTQDMHDEDCPSESELEENE